MKKVKNELKLFVTLILSVAMLVTEIPMTVFATSTEIVNDNEKEAVEEQPQAEVISEEEATGQDPEDEENSEEAAEQNTEGGESSGKESTEQDSEDEENSEEEATEQAPEDEENSEEATTGQDPEDTENNEEESIEEQDKSEESAEEIMLSSVSDFVINGSVLTSYAGTDEDVVIPEGTVEIAKNAFNNNKTIKTVTFPSTLTTIGEGAFSGCSNLKAVEFNEGLKTIKNDAFSGAALYGEKSEETNITTPGILTIPGTVQFIGYNAFSQCEYLGEVVFENGINEVLEFEEHNIFNNPAGIFEDCKNLKKVELPDRLKTISEEAFNGCTKLEEVTFGLNLEKIGLRAFCNCSSLKEAAFKENLEEIGDSAFANCSSLKAVEFNEGLKTIKNDAFSGAALCGEKSEESGITTPGTVTIPGTVQFIGCHAFNECEYLGKVIFENGINAVLELEEGNIFNDPAGIFEDCKNLKKVKLPDRLSTISEEAFNGCTKLEEVTFGLNLKKIGLRAFCNCSSLKEAAFKENLEEIGDSAFANCSSLKAVEFNEGLKTIKNDAFSGAALCGEKSEETGITTPGTVTIPGTVQFIGCHAFNKCEYLGEVIFENGINAVLELEEGNIFGNPAGIFEECKNLKKVKLPDRLKTISEEAFNGCTKLEEVTFGKILKK